MGAFSTSCHALREPLRHPLPAEHKAAASRVRAGVWAEPSPQHSLEGKMSCTARSTPVPPCAGQSCCSPPGTSCELCAELMGWHGHREGAGEELEQLRDPPAGVQVLPGAMAHPGAPCLAQAEGFTAVGSGRGGKPSGPGLHLPAGYSQAKLPPRLSTPAHGLCCRSAPR